MINVAIGDAAIEFEGREYILRPSFYSMQRIGDIIKRGRFKAQQVSGKIVLVADANGVSLNAVQPVHLSIAKVNRVKLSA